PTFTLLCQGIASISPLPSVLTGNLVSALPAALCVALVFLVGLRLKPDPIFAGAFAFAVAVSQTFWSQAIIIEVYGLAALLFVASWWMLLEFVHSGDRRWWYGFTVVLGLGLANHWPLFVLSGPGLFVLVLDRDRIASLLTPWCVTASALLLGLGLTPYLSLFQTMPQIAIYGAVDGWQQFSDYVLRSAYSDIHQVADSADRWAYLSWLVQLGGLQLGWIGIPLILGGMILSVGTFSAHHQLSHWFILLGPTLVLWMMIGFDFSPLYQAVFAPYPIIGFLSIALWAALAVSWFTGKLMTRQRWTVVAALAVTTAGPGWLQQDRSDSVLVDAYGRLVLNSLPSDAVLFVHGDNQTGPMGFLHGVEKIRPDVELRNWDNLVFNNRLVSAYAGFDEQAAALQQFIETTTRPVVVMPPGNIEPTDDMGLYFLVTKASGSRPDAGAPYAFRADFDAYLHYLLDLYEGDLLRDGHERHFLFSRLLEFSRQYVGYGVHVMNGGVVAREHDRALSTLERLETTFPGQIILLEQLVPIAITGSESQRREALKLAELAVASAPSFATPRSMAVAYEYLGRLQLSNGTTDDVVRHSLTQAIAHYPSTVNGAICPLARLLGRADDTLALQDLTRRFGDAIAACENN
ncbi:MAG: DUF2723 domain-containing protein, partial [Pseudomonadota bacterium]